MSSFQVNEICFHSVVLLFHMCNTGDRLEYTISTIDFIILQVSHHYIKNQPLTNRSLYKYMQNSIHNKKFKSHGCLNIYRQYN